MSVFLWVVVVGLGLVLFIFSVYAFTVGGEGVFSAERYVRCPRCGRHGLAAGGQLHPCGCPHPSTRSRLHHLAEARVHVRHR